MGGSAPSRQFTKEDEAVFTKLFVTIMLRTPGAAIKWLRVTAESDRRDAVMMLDNVKHHVSAVVQAPTGEWAYFIHGTVASGRWVLEL
jgi:hypothetical protein